MFKVIGSILMVLMIIVGVLLRKATGDLYITIGMIGFLFMVLGSIADDSGKPLNKKQVSPTPICTIQEGSIHVNPATLSKPKK